MLDKSTSFLAPWGDNVAPTFPPGLSSPCAQQSLLKTHFYQLPSLPCSAGVPLDPLPVKLLAHKSLSQFLFPQKETSRRSPF